MKRPYETLLTGFTSDIDLKDYKLTACYRLGQNHLIKGLDWNIFESIHLVSYSNDRKTIECIALKNKMNYSLLFERL